MPDKNIGKPVPRKEGRAKVTGAARYVDDLDAPGMLYGATVRSHVPRGRIRGITFGDGLPWDEFTVVTARDIPGANAVALILNDQPYLADGVVNHPEEPILLLAHEDKYLLEEARRAVRVCVEPLPAVFRIEDSLAQKEIVWGEDNVFKSFLVEKGNVDEAFKSADLVVVEGEYETGAQEQLYIETNGIIATASAEEGVVVRRTEPSAASARRRASSPSNDTSTKSRRQSASLPKSFADATSYGAAGRPPPDRSYVKT